MVGQIGRIGQTMGRIGHAPSKGGAAGPATELRRESDGTVTILSLGSTPTYTLTRQPDGSVIIGA